jgi:hypothetical protein
VEGQSSDFHAVISATPGDLSGDWLMVDVAPGAWDVTFTPKGIRHRPAHPGDHRQLRQI